MDRLHLLETFIVYVASYLGVSNFRNCVDDIRPRSCYSVVPLVLKEARFPTCPLLNQPNLSYFVSTMVHRIQQMSDKVIDGRFA